MAFEGDLKNLELGDVLQTLAMTRQTGTLVLKNREERRLAFGDRGIALLSARPSHGERVARYLVGSGGIDADADARARAEVRRKSAASVDEALENLGACDEATMAAARRYVALEDIYEMFTWGEGGFEFLANEMDLSGRFANIWFDVGSIAMEAARRIDELPGLDAQVPLREVFLPVSPSPGLDAERHSANMCGLFPLVDGVRTVEELQTDFHLGPFDTRKVLSSLVEHGLIRPATVDELVAVTEEAFAARDYGHAVQFLRRAVEHEPENDEFREQLANALTRSHHKRDAAECLTELGHRRHARGDIEGARSTYEAAVKLDASNASAHEALAVILLDAGDVEAGVAAARIATSNLLRNEDFEGAGRVAWMGLQHSEDDTALRMSFANALLGLGDTERAMAELDRVVEVLESSKGNDKKLLEVYRAIQRLAPERRDCARRIEEIQERERLRRKKIAVRASIAAVVVVCVAVAIPLLRGPTVQDEVDRARNLLVAGEIDGATSVLVELRERDLTEDEQIDVQGLQADIARETEPRQIRPVREKLLSLVDPLYRESAAAIEKGRLLAPLQLLDRALDILDGQDANDLAEVSPEALSALHRACESEVDVALGHVAVWAIRTADEAARVESAFANSPAFRRAQLTVDTSDLAELQDLIERAEDMRAAEAREDWDLLLTTVDQLAARIRQQDSADVQRIHDAVQSLLESFPKVAEEGERALAHAHRSQLVTRYRDTRRRATELERSGQFEEALELYREYLAFCTEVRDAPHGAVYHDIVDGYLDSLPLEELTIERATLLEDALTREKEAEQALESEQFDLAYSIRAELVRSQPAFGFEHRLQLPLRLESRPPGAQVYFLNEEGTGTLEGTTPLLLRYPVTSKTRISVRMPGFEERIIERDGALGDYGGREVVALRKKSIWDAETGAATEARAVGWKDRVFVAGRDGVVRALALRSGVVINSFETGLLGGISAAPVVFGDDLHVATVDGVGYVLDAETLTERKRYALPGAVRADLVAIERGVVVADDTGVVRLMSSAGRTLWQRRVGNVVTTPAVSERGLLVCNVAGNLSLLDPDSGRVVWQLSLPGQTRWSAPLVSGSHAYVGDDDGAVHCIDIVKRVIEWSAETEGPVSARPSVVGGRIAAGTLRGQLHLIDADTGEILETTSVGAAVTSDLATLEDHLLVVTDVGVIACCDRDGALVWRFDTGNTVSVEPTIHGEYVIAITRRGRAVAMKR